MQPVSHRLVRSCISALRSRPGADGFMQPMAALVGGMARNSHQHSSQQQQATNQGTAAAASLAAMTGLGACCFSLLGLAPSAAQAESSQEAGPSEQPPQTIKVQLPGGSKVELLAPAAGDWEVKLQNTKPPGPAPQAIQLDGRFSVPAPPYPLDALEPYMSRLTLEVHWGKHHRTYCENLNKQLAGGLGVPGDSLEEVVLASWNGGKTLPSFNNAAQVWNHTFFWDGMKPGGGGAPAAGPLADAIDRTLGGLANLRQELQTAGLTQFGSGWAWLVSDDEGNLSVFKTSNAVPPFVSGWTPLLTIDVWEHAYYLDHQNRRADYITLFLDHLVDWERVAQRYQQVLDRA